MRRENDPLFSVLIPTYNGESTIVQTLNSVLAQSVGDFEIVISDDKSNDRTVEVCRSFADQRIVILENDTNLGYPGNLRRAYSVATGKVIYLLGQDDLLRRDALELTWSAFKADAEISAVTRPYYWFEGDPSNVIRVKKRLHGQTESTVRLDINSDPLRVVEMFRTTDQLSGLAIRRDAIAENFNDAIFPCHVYPFASSFCNGAVAVLPEFVVAVRTESSQSRSLSSIYDVSPVATWLDWVDHFFSDAGNQPLKNVLRREFVASNAVGLLQIKNYSSHPIRYCWREIAIMVRVRPRNLIQPQFWTIGLACLLLPSRLTRRLTDFGKRQLVGRMRERLVDTQITE